MKRIVGAGMVLLLGVAGCKAPKCEQRKKALLGIVADEKKRFEAEKTGPVTMRFPASDPLEEAAQVRAPDWKTRGVQLNALANSTLELKDVQQALALSGATKVKLCVQQNGPVVRKYSSDADEKEAAALLAKLEGIDAIDRATVIAGEIAERKWSCKGIPSTFQAVAAVAPADRLAIIAQGTVESFDDCGCPRSDVEPAYAAVTLMADVWEGQLDCVAVKAGAESGKPLAFKADFGGNDFVAQLKAAGEAGVTVPAPPPAD